MTPRFWIGVASRTHVMTGVEAGIAQLCRGKERPLRRMRRGDGLVYYSPRTEREGGEWVQAFTTIGRVADDDVSQLTMSEAFSPFRRAIAYMPGQEAPIRPLVERLSFIGDPVRWGFPFRRCHFEISQADFQVIAAAMGVDRGNETIGIDDEISSRYDTPRESPGFLLWQVTNLWQRRQRAALKSLDLTHVQFVLLASIAWLSRDDEPVTQARLAQHAKTDPMMTSQVVRTLEQKGLATRAPHPTDSRARSLHVTRQGLELAQRAMILVEQTDEAFFSSLGESSSCLVQHLQRLLAETDNENPMDD